MLLAPRMLNDMIVSCRSVLLAPRCLEREHITRVALARNVHLDASWCTLLAGALLALRGPHRARHVPQPRANKRSKCGTQGSSAQGLVSIKAIA
eukprot:1136798-Pelagomonas_calceolata.AAC.1